MRYSLEHKAGARTRLIEASGPQVKKNGFATTGVDGLMAAAGQTSGAFYAHFGSKSELLDAIVENELQRSANLFASQSIDNAMAAIEGYLSLAHIDHPESGCAVPALATEVARAGVSTQLVFENGMIHLRAQLEQLGVSEGQAWSILAQLVGAVLIARALHSPAARKALLEGAHQHIKRLLTDSLNHTAA